MEDPKTPEVSTNEEVETPEPSAAPVEEPQPSQPEVSSEPEGQEAQPSEAAAEPAVEEPEKPRSRRESLRIAKLVDQQLRQKEQQLTPPETPKGINYRDVIEAPDELYAQLEADRKAAAEAHYTEGIKQAETIQFHTRLELDAPKIEAKFPQLDKEAPEFKPVVADAINNWYLATVGFNPKTNTVQNPNIRYSEFVESIMELADEMAGEKVAATSKNIAKQAATTGLRPDGSSARGLNLNKAPEDMTDEELEASIAQGMPRK